MHYDPVLCMNVPDKARDSKACDVKQFSCTLSEARKYLENKYVGKIDVKQGGANDYRFYYHGKEVGFFQESRNSRVGKFTDYGKMVDAKTVDAGYEYRIVENTGFNKSNYPYTLQFKNALGWANSGTYETKKDAIEAAKRFNKNYAADADTCDAARAYSVGYKSNGVFQSIGVMANSENEAVEKAKRYFASKGRAVEVYGASIGESLETMKMKGKPVLDKAIRACDFAGFVLKKKNGYELGVNPNHVLYLAFPGESMSNPHMYLGKDDPSNRTKAEQMFNDFANMKK